MLFTRQIDWIVEPEKGAEFLSRYQGMVKDVLREHEGYVTHMVLAEGPRYVTLTFWKTQSAAQLFAQRGFAKLHTNLKSCLSGEPQVRSLMLIEGSVPSATETVAG